jgi:hypothetical protein
VNSAQTIIQILWKPSGNGKDDHLDDIWSSEKVDMIYSAALVLIAARSIPAITKLASSPDAAESSPSGHRVPDLTKSITALTTQISKANVMLRQCEDRCDLYPEFCQRISRARRFLDLAGLQSHINHGAIPDIVSDGDLKITRSIWKSLYGRLFIDFTLDKDTDDSSGQSMLFCWLESLVIDFR